MSPIILRAKGVESEGRRENAGVLSLVLFQNVGLHRAAHLGHRARGDLFSFLGGREAALAFFEGLGGLIDGRIEIKREQHRRGTVDGHRHGSRGVTKVEPGVELLCVLESADAYAALSDFAVNVGPALGILAVKRDTVEGRRKALRSFAGAQKVKALIGARRRAFSGEHALRSFGVAF
jgi:hypothetical protein